MSAPPSQPMLFGSAAARPAAAPASISLRPYQTQAIAEVYAHRRPGARVLCVAPTGAGKTVIGSQMILDELASGGRVIFLAHRTELIAQTYAKLLAMGLDESLVGVIMADGVIPHPVTGRRVCCKRPLAPVQVASIDTLRRRPVPAGVTLVLIDECHRSLAKSYRDVVAACPQALTVGLTATPYRGDGRGLGDLFEHLVVVTTPRALMAEGFLAEPRVFSHPHRVDTSKVATVAGEFNQQQLAEAADKRELLGSIVEHWKRHLDGVRTVAFAVNVAHSRHIAEQFVEAGVPAEHLDGETPAEERAGILARVDRGETLVVSNCGVLCEGWDQPSVKGCILARPTKSRALYVQCAGRVLRPWRGETPVILDHAGSVLDHDLPHADWEITLDGKKKKAKQSVAIKECPSCFAACPSNARTCFFCQHPFTDDTDSSAGDPLEERAGDLVEIRADALRALKLQTAGARGELNEWTNRVDHAEGLESGSTNRRAFKVFRKSRSEMTPWELANVRAWMLCEWPWLAPAPVAAPLRFAVPTIAEASPW